MATSGCFHKSTTDLVMPDWTPLWHHYCMFGTVWVYQWPCHVWLSTHADITTACLGQYEYTTDLVMPDWTYIVKSYLPVWDTMSLLLTLLCLTEHTLWHHTCLFGTPWVYRWPCHAWLTTHGDINTACLGHHESTADLVSHARMNTHGDISSDVDTACLGHHKSTTDLVSHARMNTHWWHH